MITAVLDANVLASGFRGFLNPASAPGQLIRTWLDGCFQLVVSEHLITELTNTFCTRYFTQHLTSQEIADALLVLRRRATHTPIIASVRDVATHPEDELVLATAVSAQADYLVTGDTKLQKLRTYQGVSIVSPREFLEILEAGGE
ncbi:MAG: putative toxin-antitoxin system toxin component, PIN family [Chloroflexi bacterium]|nr:putative toxin-antitoxin system toxin component, PIN family [Chloroflexota bacterium]